MNINQSVEEYITGANGDLSRDEIADALASELCDYVSECFIDDGWHNEGGYGIISERLQRKVCRMIAYSLINQYVHDLNQCEIMIDAIVNERDLPSEPVAPAR
jgi:hypothetical protein